MTPKPPTDLNTGSAAATPWEYLSELFTAQWEGGASRGSEMAPVTHNLAPPGSAEDAAGYKPSQGELRAVRTVPGGGPGGAGVARIELAGATDTPAPAPGAVTEVLEIEWGGEDTPEQAAEARAVARIPRGAARSRAFWRTAVSNLVRLKLGGAWHRVRYRSAARREAARLRLHGALARRTLRMCLRLRGSFVKLGQAAAAAQALPPPWREELAVLQDGVPPRPPSAVRAILQESLGEEAIAAQFRSLDLHQPIGCASVGQCHRGVLRDGREVVVKVLYPEVEALFEDDLANVAKFARRNGTPEQVELLEAVRAQIFAEFDFALERASMEAVGSNTRARYGEQGRPQERADAGGRPEDRPGRERAEKRASGGGPQERAGAEPREERAGDGHPEERAGGRHPEERAGGGHPEERAGGGHPEERAGDGHPEERAGGGQGGERAGGARVEERAGNRQVEERAAGERPAVVVPQPVPGLCTRNVLVMDHLPGRSLRDVMADAFASLAASLGLTAEQLREAVATGNDPTGNNAPGNAAAPEDGAGAAARRRVVAAVEGAAAAGLQWAQRRLTRGTQERLARAADRLQRRLRPPAAGASPPGDGVYTQLLRVQRAVDTVVETHGAQVLVDGVFNADPHPGNILLTEDGQVGLIDFGQVHRLTEEERRSIAELYQALAAEDQERAVAVLRRMGLRTKHGHPQAMYAHAVLRLDRWLTMLQPPAADFDARRRPEHGWPVWVPRAEAEAAPLSWPEVMKTGKFLRETDDVEVWPHCLLWLMRVVSILRGTKALASGRSNPSIVRAWEPLLTAALQPAPDDGEVPPVQPAQPAEPGIITPLLNFVSGAVLGPVADDGSGTWQPTLRTDAVIIGGAGMATLVCVASLVYVIWRILASPSVTNLNINLFIFYLSHKLVQVAQEGTQAPLPAQQDA